MHIYISGYGRLLWGPGPLKGDRYDGEFLAGVRHGQGRIISAHGAVLEAGFLFGKVKKTLKTNIPAHGADLDMSFAKQKLGLSDTLSLSFFHFFIFKIFIFQFFLHFVPCFSTFPLWQDVGGRVLHGTEWR
jgi:hypothetical protein